MAQPFSVSSSRARQITPFPCAAKLSTCGFEDRPEYEHAHSVHGYGIFSVFKVTPPRVHSAAATEERGRPAAAAEEEGRSAAAGEEGGRHVCFICLDDEGVLLANVCGCYSSHVHAKCLKRLQATDDKCRVCTQHFRAATEKPFIWQKPARAWAAIVSSSVLACFATFYLVRGPTHPPSSVAPRDSPMNALGVCSSPDSPRSTGRWPMRASRS